MKYIVNDGTLLLSAAAEKLATDLGVESGAARSYARGADGNKAGVSVRKGMGNHPVWDGFKLAEGDKLELTTLGFPTSSDYYDAKLKDGVNIGDCWENATEYADRIGAFVEWSNKNTGKGVVFGMGWRLAHWTEDNKERATLEKMTTNVINYLASKSAYFAVNPSGSLVTTWGELKK